MIFYKKSNALFQTSTLTVIIIFSLYAPVIDNIQVEGQSINTSTMEGISDANNNTVTNFNTNENKDTHIIDNSTTNNITKKNVIFIHPDGITQSHFNAIRLIEAGPDGSINWDNLTQVAIYKGHLKDSLTSTSHGGATVHGSGVKVLADSYGCDGNCSEDTIKRTIMEEARDQNFSIGIINSGTITEPGSGAFLSHVTERSNHCGIVQEIVEESNADLIMGAGEKYYLSANDTRYHPNTQIT